VASSVDVLPDYSLTSSLSVEYGVAPASDGSLPSKVELYRRFKPVGGTFGGWTLVATATGSYDSPFELSGLADGTYEFYTRAYGADGYVEAKAGADRVIRIDSAGSPMSWVDGPAEDAAANPLTAISYRYVVDGDSVPPSKVELYQRFKPVGGSFGAWTLVGTITDPLGAPFSVTQTADGTYEYYTRAYDGSGTAEQKAAAEATIVLDRIAGSSTMASLPAVLTAGPATLSYDSHESSTSGVAAVDLYYRYKPTSAAWPEEWTRLASSEQSIGSYPFDFPDGPGYYQFYSAVTDNAGNAEPVPDATTSPKASTKFDPALAGGTYYTLATPQRVMASKANIGLSGAFTWLQPRTFQVAGVMGIPADATGITGTVTITNQTAENYLAVGPALDSNLGISTLNFSATGNYSAGITTALAPDGKLTVVLGGPNSSGTVQAILDVTGYFRASSGGATYYGMATPKRLVDSRVNKGITTGLSAGVVKSFQVTGLEGVPSGATAVTGTLTITGQTQAGWVAMGPTSTTGPSWATLFFSTTSVSYSAGVTTKLGSTGQLYIIYMASAGKTAKVIFDITGYYMPGTGGARYFGLQTPTRIVDSRDPQNLGGPLAWLAPQTFQVTGWGGVPDYAVGITGNPTITQQNAVGYIAIEPTATASPGWSTANFAATGNIGVGVTSALGEGGTLSVMAGGGYSTLVAHFLFDVTGYFVNPVP
jgi:hypothetical protein